MQNKTNALLAALLATALAGCSREDATDSGAAAPSAGVPADNVFSDQVQALDKAKGVQQAIDTGAVRTREAVERQERP